MSNTCASCKIWSKFYVKNKDGNVIKLRIQELPKEMKDDVIEFLVKYYMTEEAFQVAAGISKSEKAIEEYRERIKALLQSPKTHSLICCADKSNIDQVIGLSFMQLVERTESVQNLLTQTVFETKEMEEFLNILKFLEEYSGEKPFETRYQGRGIVIHPNYRGLGLSNEFVRMRKVICIDHNVPMTSAWMTALTTQKAAEKANWKTHTEISPDELGKMTGLTFEKKVPSFKLMYTTID